MKTMNVIYKFGNLYNKETRKRILINDGAEISIVISPNDLLTEDPNLKPEKILGALEKEAEILEFMLKEQKGDHWKLFESSKILYFKISAGVKHKDKTEQLHWVFQVKLLEDLFIYNKKDEPKYARFFDCYCLVEKCLNNLDFFEPVYGTSLNDAYTKTYELYFAMFGKSTANAFDRFFEKQDMKVPIRAKTESIQAK